ncbi:alpha/beta hydrolase [Sphingopyxis indica]|uniref:alpha/beta fold hydrolase n=1 Tax=Sphingopyxis indica TaxID=436663 RepID=UPI0029390267|nr:alpha/beta hydrolase [Sphingopyxis indica]WOF43001.1 alpha/beta hydrolase [Sphingopyxis indica]
MATYRMHGRGPIHAVAIHGWFNDHAAFDAMLTGIDPDRFSLLLLDLRGYGSRRDSDGPFDIETMAADALTAADAVGWDRFSVIGHSMGGKAALKLALTAAERVEKIVGITPVWAGAAPFDPPTRAYFQQAAASLEIREAILDLTTGSRLPLSWLKRAAERSAAISDQGAFAAYFESWSGDDFANDASAIEQPVLVFAGGRDKGIPEELIRTTWLSSLSRAGLVVLPEAGHYPMDECPLILAAEVVAFLDPQQTR